MTDLATYDIRTVDGYRLIIAAGEIDIGNAGDFRQTLQDAAPAGTEALIISLTEINYLDSSALAVLIDVCRRFGVSRRQLRVVCQPDSPCGRLMRIAGVHNLFPLYASIDEAIVAIAAN